MTDREKLIEILRAPIYSHELADPAEVVADYLLDNGVTFAKDNNVLTNGDRIRAMTDEELAVLLMCPYGAEDYIHEGGCALENCYICTLGWLKQEAE